MNRSIPKALCAFAAAILIALLAACGGETSRAGTSTTVAETPDYGSGQQLASTPAVAVIKDPARRAYVSRVDGVCRKLDRERNAAREHAAAGVETSEGAQAYDDSIALGWRQLHAIEAIPPPPSDAALLRTNVYDVLHRQLEIRRQMGTALAATDVAKLQTLRVQLDSLTQSLLGFARGYGFQVCGED